MHTAPSAASVEAIAPAAACADRASARALGAAAVGSAAIGSAAVGIAAIGIAARVASAAVVAALGVATRVAAMRLVALLRAVAIARRATGRSGARRACGPAMLVALLAAALPPASAQQPVPVPPLAARVTDLTGTLSAAQRASLDAQLAAIEQRKGAQVAILMLPTTQPEPIEAYGIRVAEAWKLGRGRERAQRDTGDPKAGAIDDGVLLIVAKDDRRVRIEVGYGLEGAIPDAVAKRIITESITPRFRSGDFAGGLEAAVADLARRIDGEPLPEPWQPPRGAQVELDGGLLPVVLMAFVVGLLVSKAVGRFVGAVVGGGGAGVGATAALASTGLGAAVGLGVGVLILAIGGRRGGGPGGTLRRTGRRTIGHGPVIVPGPGWGGGGWGSGGGGGGFGGGGGGFGGGGASGDW